MPIVFEQSGGLKTNATDTNQTMGTNWSGKQLWLILFLAVAVIVAGVWWYASRQGTMPAAIDQETGTPVDIQALNTQSSSDEVGAIDADLKATNLDNLDKEMGNISNTVSQ